MKLYIGGRNQGQKELAVSENPNAEIFADLNSMIREWLSGNADLMEKTIAFCEDHPHAVFISDEIGCGVVPMEKGERHWREQVGRVQCLIAERADCVIRVICGIGVRIK